MAVCNSKEITVALFKDIGHHFTMNNFVKSALQAGGSIHPLLVPANLTGGTGLMNPSIYNDNGKIIGVIRHVNYTFYHSENKVFLHPWGPLTYLHPENDLHLRTRNFYCEFDTNLNIVKQHEIDMTHGDSKYTPVWEFRGLEDARIMRWNGKLFIAGVRRDLKPNGEGRMDLCEIVVDNDRVYEVDRFRIPPPNNPDSYCEKNWMPIIDIPYHFVKWSTPTEVVCADPATKTCKTVVMAQNNPNLRRDVRGGSQLIPLGKDGHRIAMTHEVDLFKSEVGRKDAVYHHRFLIWDKDWNIVKFSREFFMMDGHVEFGIGMCYLNESEFLITFGFQDNAAYLLRCPVQHVLNFINENS